MPITATSTSWLLETQHTGYAIGLNQIGMVAHRYWGERLPRPEDYPPAIDSEGWASFNGSGQIVPEEYPTYGGAKYIESCLKVTFADEVRDVVLKFDRAEVRSMELDLYLSDVAYLLEVVLHYRVHETYDLIERWVTVTNRSESPMTLERIWSAQWHLPPGEVYQLMHLSGRWADENQRQRDVLSPGLKIIESRRLTTSHHHQPWFAVDRGLATEDNGEVWTGALAWSGNWKLSAEVTDFSSTRISLGVNDWDFAWRLEAGTSFTTPSSLAGYTTHGFGAASRQWHDYIRDCVLPHGKTLHKVLYNSWEATMFNVDEASQIALAEVAASLGVELFVMDDGWFHGRTWDDTGLGDWWPDEVKFPNGLHGLIEKVNSLGMDFGLWIEPEMVNPDSELHRAHPDWVIHFPTRARTELRHQLILNLARADVQDHLIETIDRLLKENNIAFIKWDMNRNVSEPGWPDAPGDPRELWVRYLQGLYRVWGTLRERHPSVIWQSCSGGGGRADLGILRFADQIWVSDNTEATARLRIQEGFSQLFPANVMEAWVTDTGKGFVPLEFRFHASMCGALGVGGNLLDWDEADRTLARRCITLYQELRPIIQYGDQYRLRSPRENGLSAVQYLSKDRAEGVLFAFRVYVPDPAQLPPLYLRGLDPTALYEIEGEPQPRSGLAWMKIGLQVDVNNLGSVVKHIRRVT